MNDVRSDVTVLLGALGAGDPTAADKLFPIVYDELRQMAQRLMSAESAGNTLQPTALVHEAYLRLVGEGNSKWEHRRYFFGTAAKAMRRILAERGRHKARPKHGGDRVRVSLDGAAATGSEAEPDWNLIDELLTPLETEDPRACQVVELRVFAGRSVEETALLLDISESTVKREYDYARAWIAERWTRTMDGKP